MPNAILMILIAVVKSHMLAENKNAQQVRLAKWRYMTEIVRRVERLNLA